MASGNHVSMVRYLYKSILRLHKGMPVEFRALGDQYTREEFKRHKNCEKAEADKFMLEWTDYYVTLARQLAKRKVSQDYGKMLSEDQLEHFSEEQIGQLHELKSETVKPLDMDNPLGENPSAPPKTTT